MIYKLRLESSWLVARTEMKKAAHSTKEKYLPGPRRCTVSGFKVCVGVAQSMCMCVRAAANFIC